MLRAIQLGDVEQTSLVALKRSDQEGNSGEVRHSTEEKKRRVLFQ